MTGWKIDLRWHDGRLTDRTETPDAALAVEAFRALLRREDLEGQPVAARMVSPATRKSVYFSRFDGAPGTLRIHPDAPIDPFADRDRTAEAAEWRPARQEPHDWEADHRPYDACLKDWRQRHGWTWAQTAEHLREKPSTLKLHADGRFPADTRQRRRLMTLIDRTQP